MLEMRHLLSSSTRFMIMPTLLISLWRERSSTSLLISSCFLMTSTVLSTLTWLIPLNLLSQRTALTCTMSLILDKLNIYRGARAGAFMKDIQDGEGMASRSTCERISINYKEYIRQMTQQKKLKLIISSLKEREVLQFFEICCESCLCDLRKSIKKISFNCYEATLDYRNHLTNGYGKNYNEALVSAVNNLLEKLLEDQRTHPALRECLKRFSHTCSPDLPSEKVKTLPDAPDKRGTPATRTIDSSCRPKENLMKSIKTIKQEIFESLNPDNIHLRPAQQTPLTKNTSYSVLGLAAPQRQDELQLVLNRVRELEEKLQAAEGENEYLKTRMKEKEGRISQQITSTKQLQKSFQEVRSYEKGNTKDNYNRESTKIYEKESIKGTFDKDCLKDISAKLNNISEANSKDSKMRSYSLSNSANPSAFSSKEAPKVKIPKLNLQVLPNYHGKSNKSLNQSLLQTYGKKAKGNV